MKEATDEGGHDPRRLWLKETAVEVGCGQRRPWSKKEAVVERGHGQRRPQ